MSEVFDIIIVMEDKQLDSFRGSDLLEAQYICSLDSFVKKLNGENFGRASVVPDAERMQDLGYMAGILVAEGGEKHKNGFWFDRHELIASYTTPLLKPFNKNHNAKDIIGTIYDSALVHIIEKSGEDTEYEMLDLSKDIIITADGRLDVVPEKCPIGIAIAAVVWKMIHEDEWKDILNGYATGKVKLSMETYYQNYSYRLGADNASCQIVERTTENQQMMDKLIGKTFQGKKVYKAYRGLTFAGVAKTPIPAEYRSWILDAASLQGEKLNKEMLAAAAALLEPEEPTMEKQKQDEAAVWKNKTQNNLPDAAFAYIEPGGERDRSGMTVPRSLRHFPHHNSSVENGSENSSVDLPHLRNALARCSQSEFGPKALPHLQKHAKALLKTKKTKASVELCWDLGNNETAVASSIELRHIDTAGEMVPSERYVPSPFELAVNCGDVKTVSTLLDGGANPNEKTESGYPVIWNCYDEKVALLLIERGADISYVSEDKHTMLHMAARANWADVCKLLVEKGLDIHAKDKYGWTPLHSACCYGSHRAVEYLLSVGATPDLGSDQEASPSVDNNRDNSTKGARIMEKDLTQAIAEQSVDLHTANQKIETLTQENEALKAELAAVQSAKAEVDSKVEGLTADVARIQSEFDTFKAQIETEKAEAEKTKLADTRISEMEKEGLVDESDRDAVRASVRDMSDEAFASYLDREKKIALRAAERAKETARKAEAQSLGLPETASAEEIVSARQKLFDQAAVAVPSAPKVDTSTEVKPDVAASIEANDNRRFKPVLV